MSQEAGPVSFRLEPAVIDVLRRISNAHRLPEPLMLERLILEEGARLGKLTAADDPNAALHELLRGIADLVRDGHIEAHPDITLTVFRRIKAEQDLCSLWERATKPRRGERPEKRRQWVNGRIARYNKHLIGWDSAEEVTLPKNEGALIQGYTRFKKPKK